MCLHSLTLTQMHTEPWPCLPLLLHLQLYSPLTLSMTPPTTPRPVPKKFTLPETSSFSLKQLILKTSAQTALPTNRCQIPDPCYAFSGAPETRKTFCAQRCRTYQCCWPNRAYLKSGNKKIVFSRIIILTNYSKCILLCFQTLWTPCTDSPLSRHIIVILPLPPWS